jgi:hypothetical protein
MSGYHKSNAFRFCRALTFLFAESIFIYTLVLVFWFTRIDVVFGGYASHRLSKRERQFFFAGVALLLLTGQGSVVISGLLNTKIDALKSTDINVFRRVNDNPTICTTSEKTRILPRLFFPINGIIYLSLTIWVSYLYSRKLRAVLTRRMAQSETSEKEKRVIRKTVIIALVSLVSSMIIPVIGVSLQLYIFFPIDLTVNIACVLLYFDFSKKWYDVLCAPCEKCLKLESDDIVPALSMSSEAVVEL